MRFIDIQKDKLLHYFYGSIIAFPLVLLFCFYGVVITLLIATIKEVVYDKLLKRGTFEVLDIVYTVTPSFLFYIIYTLKI